jgi:hypothetical protein
VPKFSKLFHHSAIGFYPKERRVDTDCYWPAIAPRLASPLLPTSPILQQRQPELQVGGVAYRCPIEFRHQVARLEPGTLGRRLRVDRGQTRGIEDAAFIGGGFEFDNVAPILLNGRPFPNVYRRQRKGGWLSRSVQGGTL